MDPTGSIARRFPLIARPRPACLPIETRVARLCVLADSAERDGNQVAASTVYNQAALLASDLDLPDLTHAWCHRHATIYLRALPLNASTARHALEPVVNLARLHIRDGNGDTAFHLLDDLYQAVTSRTDTVVDGLPIPASRLTCTSEDHQELRRWLWSVRHRNHPGLVRPCRTGDRYSRPSTGLRRLTASVSRSPALIRQDEPPLTSSSSTPGLVEAAADRLR